MLKKEVRTEIVINSSPEIIWDVLMNFESYPEWNPFIKSIQGNPKVGGRITAKIQPPESKEMTFKPTVLTNEKHKSFSWLGQLYFKGLFDGEHIFELVDNGNTTTTFIQREKFSGILVPLLKKMLDNNTRKGFEAMNQKLKELAENGK